MFRYLISPASGNHYTPTAITITGDMITAYHDQKLSLWDRLKNSLYRMIGFRFKNYGIVFDSDRAYRKENGLYFRNQYFTNHTKLHSNPDEFWIQHVHIHHGDKIKSKQVRLYLDHKNHFFRQHTKDSVDIFSKETIDDIVNCYEQHLSFGDNRTRTYSNHPHYQFAPQNMPSIGQHSLCVYNGYTACDVNNPYPHLLARPEEPAESVATAIATTAVVTLGVLTLFGLFKMSARQPISLQNTQSNSEKEVLKKTK